MMEHETDVITKLKRALNLAIVLNDNDLIDTVKQTFIKYENTIATKDSPPELWGFCFDELIDNKKVNLKENEENDIILSLEKRLYNLNDNDPWDGECIVSRLAEYYDKKNASSPICMGKTYVFPGKAARSFKKKYSVSWYP